MRLQILFLLVIMSCTAPQKAYRYENGNVKQTISLPIWLEYSQNVPDSIKDFTKIYFELKQNKVIPMKEAIELLIGQGNDIFMNNLPPGNTYEPDYISKLEKMRKPVCNFLATELFEKEIANETVIDSIRWFVLQKPSNDTIKIYHSFYPEKKNANEPYIVWRNFADTVLASGLLK